MKQIPLNNETQAIAERLIWFEPADVALSNPVRFMAYAFARATHEDMKVLQSHVGEDGLREALDNAPAGIIDPRSWAYWNARMGRYSTPRMPGRRLA